MTWIDNIEQIVAAYPLLAFGAVFLLVSSRLLPLRYAGFGGWLLWQA